MSGVDHGRTSRNRGWTAVATGGVAVEAIALVGTAVVYAFHAGGAEVPMLSVGIAAFCALSGAGLGLVAVGLWRGRRWAVAPALTWQVLQIFAGFSLMSSLPWLGAPMIPVAVATLVAVSALRREAQSATA